MAKTSPAGEAPADPRPGPGNFLAGQGRVLAGVASGEPLATTLEALTRLIQSEFAGALCAVLLVNESGQRLEVAAAPDLPEGYRSVPDGFVIDPEASCCGTAAATGQPVVGADLTEARWAAKCSVALDNGLRACWSIPILSSANEVLGIFALFYREIRDAQPEELASLVVATHLATVAIERSRQGEAYARTEYKYRAIVEHTRDAVFIADDQRCFVEANPAACALLGLTPEQIVGAPVERHIKPVPSPDLPDRDIRWNQLLRDGHRSCECVLLGRDGSRRHAEVHGSANILPGLHMFVAHDITEKRSSQEAIRWAEQLYRTLVETTNTGYVIADERGYVIDANAEYVHLSGHERFDQIRGRHPREWVAENDRQRFGDASDSCLSRGFVRNLEVDFVDANGHRIPVEISTSAVRAEERTRLLSLCRDITGRHQTQQELLAAHLELETRVRTRTAELHTANGQIRSRACQQEAVANLGRRALAGADIDTVMQHAVEVVAKVLELELCAVLEHAAADPDHLVLRASVGWSDQAAQRLIATIDPTQATGYALQFREPVAFEDLDRESRFSPTPGMREAGIVSGIAVSISDEQGQIGLLAAYGKRRRPFTADDRHFLQSMAHVLAAAIERRNAEETIRQAREGAINANNAKTDFLSRMSHELRTPLNAILGFSQLLEIERLDLGQRESVEQISRAGRHLLELVNEVLDISRIDSGNMALVPEPLAIEDLLREAVDLIRPLADARGITIVTNPDAGDGPSFVLADRQRLRQVMLNLLSNAVKYNNPAGRVTLDRGISPEGNRSRLSVTDTGGGITPENLPLLFTPFERLGAETTNVEGSGMGLALSKRLVEAQGGVMGVDSAVGIGSTFWIDLPIAAAPLGDREPPALFDELLRSQLFEDDEFPMSFDDEQEGADAIPVTPDGLVAGESGRVRQIDRAEASAAAAVPALGQPSGIVLHIEDNEPNQRLIEMLLSQRPTLRLMTASRGAEGLQLAQQYHPDLILLDVHLPDTSGENVLHDLRADAHTRDTPVVIVSADATSIRHQQLHEIGANDYLLKPFNVTQFLKILDEYLCKAA